MRRVPYWLAPALAALVLILAGCESPRAALDAIAHQWNVLLFIAGLMGLSAAAQCGGVYQWIADVLLQHARGSSRRLFVLLFAAGALVTLVLSNDATAIGFAPIVYRSIGARAGNDPRPYLFASIFVANAASFGLPFSNPANVLILPHPDPAAYLRELGVPQILALALNLALLLFFFRRELRARCEFAQAGPPGRRCLRTIAVLLCAGLAYVAALWAGWPLGPVAVAGAAVALLASRSDPREAAGAFSWGIFGLLAALFVLMDAVTRAGLGALLSRALDAAAAHGALAAQSAAAAGSAALSNVFNNLPIAVAASYLVAHGSSQRLAYALIAGVDVGPNLLASGSLATILWLAVLRRYGLRMSPWEYARIGAVLVPATLGVCVLWLVTGGR